MQSNIRLLQIRNRLGKNDEGINLRAAEEGQAEGGVGKGGLSQNGLQCLREEHE